jgi:glycosyltransferase involved in cell wall biosynthesis
LLIPVRDSAALADAIRRLDDDRKLCRRLGLAAREKALSEFDESIVISKTLRVYSELLDPVPQEVVIAGQRERQI